MTASARFSARVTSASAFRRARVTELQLQVGWFVPPQCCSGSINRAFLSEGIRLANKAFPLSQLQSLEEDEVCCQHTGNAKPACRRQRADKAAEAGEMKVTCGWARGCNTGHGSCLSLPLVSCVAASGTAALSTSETEPSRSGNITPSYSGFL
ncbi:hypothetical protein DPX16_17569 [Anabarilius grahami]|uniref:Uncharacterized protein n=1 Tax=Anabarilius grahami TaxID=495550 RepID=A0A3N0XZQ7_ANAGA|nr:hypothetical protein DPX16_17569 [Anabarilius grahami]